MRLLVFFSLLTLLSCGKKNSNYINSNLSNPRITDFQQNSSIVKECINSYKGRNSKIDINRKILIKLKSTGSLTFFNYLTPKYTIRALKNTILIILGNVYFLPEQNSTKFKILKKKVKSSKKCVIDFFNKQGLNLRVNFKFIHKSISPYHYRAYNSVILNEGSGQSTMKNWYLEYSHHTCQLIIHKISHFLGLYRKSNLTSENYLADQFDILNIIEEDVEKLYFTPNDIKHIVGPICNKTSEDLVFENGDLMPLFEWTEKNPDQNIVFKKHF